MTDMAEIAAALIHFTGYEKSIASIRVPGPVCRLLGNLLGTADLMRAGHVGIAPPPAGHAEALIGVPARIGTMQISTK